MCIYMYMYMYTYVWPYIARSCMSLSFSSMGGRQVDGGARGARRWRAWRSCRRRICRESKTITIPTYMLLHIDQVHTIVPELGPFLSRLLREIMSEELGGTLSAPERYALLHHTRICRCNMAGRKHDF